MKVQKYDQEITHQLQFLTTPQQIVLNKNGSEILNVTVFTQQLSSQQ